MRGLHVGDSRVMDTLIVLASLALRLGQVQRATRHPDGERESDATHTVMLALTGAWLVSNVAPFHHLQAEKVLYYAIIHDLPEALTGDINTLRGLRSEDQQAKDLAEARAVAQIVRECPELGPWIEAYTTGSDPEARFVRYLDKILPKLTHVLNGGLSLRLQGVATSAELCSLYGAQADTLASRYPELTGLHRIYAASLFFALKSFEMGRSVITPEVAPPRGDAARFTEDPRLRYASFDCRACGLLWDARVAIPDGLDAAIKTLACPSCRAGDALASLRCVLRVDSAGYAIDPNHPLWVTHA